MSVHLLKAERPSAQYISVESINHSEASDVDSIVADQFKGSQFKQIYRELMTNDDVIIDVGASNVAVFMEELTKYRSAIGEFDIVVIPTVPAEKQQKDTIATIEWLSNLGIPAEKIRVVFNQYGAVDTLNETYAHVQGYASSVGQTKASWLPHVIIKNNEVFEMVKAVRATIRELALDKTDWVATRKQAKADKDMDAFENACDSQIRKDLAISAYSDLQQGYQALLTPYIKKAKK
ncbi:hypothetical protein JAB4_059490 (plasmid) [Janthinobacterium sp. HH102]|nr:hypothetical protein JAB4_059490 [Janthinobacterium sp. HH102]